MQKLHRTYALFTACRGPKPGLFAVHKQQTATQTKGTWIWLQSTPPRVQLSAGTNGRIGQLFASLVATIVAWNDTRVTRNALSQLSDRELEDIGLCRGDIDNIAAKR